MRGIERTTKKFPPPLTTWAVLLLAGILLLQPSPVSADEVIPVAGPYIDQVSPPVLTRGRTNRIQISGRELDEALDLWTSIPNRKLKAKRSGTNDPQNDSQQVSFDVEVPANTPLGLYGLRVATRSGLSNVHLFLVEELPVQSHVDSESSPMKVTLPAAIHSTCREATADHYEITVRAGERVSFEVVGNRFGKDLDPLVTIRNSKGRIVAERDNDVGLFFDCRFQHTFAEAGNYEIEVRDARYFGDPTWHYLLRMGDFPVARVAVPASVTPGKTTRLNFPQIPGKSVELNLPADAPLGWNYQEIRLKPESPATWIALHADHSEKQLETEPNETREEATPVKLPATLHGVLTKVDDHDWFQFEMKKGELIRFRGEARGFGSPADLELVLLNQDGREVRRIDDVLIREGQESWSVESNFEYSAPKDGPHFLCVQDLSGAGGPAFAYRVEVRPAGPRLELKSAVSRITLPRENFQPIPLKVTRSHFAGAIELELIGAPAGVTLEPTTIPADVTEMVCKLKADNSALEGLATIQIVGRWKSDDPKQPASTSALATTFPLIDCRVKNKDLRLLAMRADQRNPPPSLTNQFALFITPPAPFDVELPEAELLITKYLDGRFPIKTTRTTGFTSPITFTAEGGQIGDEAEERSNLFLRIPVATAAESEVSGLIYNRILTRYEKFRVDLSATATAGNRRITLNRTFNLDVKAAFAPAPESTTLEIDVGGTARIRLLANRTPAFNGGVTITCTRLNGFTHPETIEIPASQPEVEFEVKADPKTSPGRYQLRMESRGIVGRYEEQVRGPYITITIKKPPAK